MKTLFKRNFVGVIAAIILVMASVAACAPEAAPPTEPAAPPVEPIVLGAPADLGTTQVDMYRGAALAAKEINAEGGVLVGGVKRPLKIVTADTRDVEPTIPIHDVILAYADLISRENPFAFVAGPIRSEALFAVMENLAEDKIIHIFSGGVSPKFQAMVKEDYDKYKYFFRNSGSSINLALGLASAMGFVKEEFGFSKVFFLTEDVDFARAMEGFMSPYSEKMGWEVVGSAHTPLGITDYSAALIKLKDSGADVAFMSYSSEAAPLAKQHKAMKLSALLIGVCNPLSGPYAYEASEGAVENFIGIICGAGNVAVLAMPKTVEFLENFEKEFDAEEEAILGSAESYDAVYILADAIERAGSLDSDAVVTALEATDYAGVVGRTRFDPQDHQAVYGFDPAETLIQPVFQWQNGKRVPVFPESIAEAEIQLP